LSDEAVFVGISFNWIALQQLFLFFFPLLGLCGVLGFRFLFFFFDFFVGLLE
jgi:hypothetical protein